MDFESLLHPVVISWLINSLNKTSTCFLPTPYLLHIACDVDICQGAWSFFFKVYHPNTSDVIKNQAPSRSVVAFSRPPMLSCLSIICDWTLEVIFRMLLHGFSKKKRYWEKSEQLDRQFRIFSPIHLLSVDFSKFIYTDRPAGYPLHYEKTKS